MRVWLSLGIRNLLALQIQFAISCVFVQTPFRSVASFTLLTLPTHHVALRPDLHNCAHTQRIFINKNTIILSCLDFAHSTNWWCESVGFIIIPLEDISNPQWSLLGLFGWPEFRVARPLSTSFYVYDRQLMKWTVIIRISLQSDSASLWVTHCNKYEKEQFLRLKVMNKQDWNYCGNVLLFVAAYVEKLSVS